ncbi:MAG: ATP-binding protein [Planctomycetota bacterium]|nr:MAG: ATP-binding protein [Planctomycetota bacterium]
MIYSLSMENVGPAPIMELEFGTRLNLITGDNGLGKSFLLDTIWWALTRKWPQQLNPKLNSGYMAKPTNPKREAKIGFRVGAKSKPVNYESVFVPRDQAWTGKSGRLLNPGLVIYAQADGGFSVWDPARNYWKKSGQVDIQDRLSGFVFTAGEVWNELKVEDGGREIRVCNGLLADLALWIASDSPEARNMNAVLQRLSPSSLEEDQISVNKAAVMSIDDSRMVPYVQFGPGKPIPVLYASSGIKRITQLAYMLVWTWLKHKEAAKELGETRTNRVVFLIDEIECHLHPRWQRTILRSLLEMIQRIHKNAEIQLIAATHSPLVLASAEPFFDANNDAWFDLDLDRQSGRIELQKRTFVRLGGVGNWLTSEAFDLATERSLEAEQAIHAARACFVKADVKSPEVVSVDQQLMSTLGSEDRFWREWERFLEAKGIKTPHMSEGVAEATRRGKQ